MSGDRFYEDGKAVDITKEHSELQEQLQLKENEWEAKVSKLDH